MTENKRFSWAVDQMTTAGMSETDKKQVQELLEVYWKNENTEVLKAFTSLAQDTPLVAEDEDNGKWLDAKPGNVYVRDIVRVKEFAYPVNDHRNSANGREGVVVGIRYGIVSVHYTDGPGSEVPASFAQHRLQLLEKRY
jgi:hypothetical protein